MNLKQQYKDIILPNMIDKFQYTNLHQVPKVEKIIITAGLGLNAQNNKYLQNAIEEFRLISGQQPIVTYAKKSIAAFKVRENMILGLKVTLRRKKMYFFLERLIKIVLPRIRDFRGLNIEKFDKFSNYHFGISEQLVFPEINYDSVDQIRGFNISIITTSKKTEEAKFLLKEFGFPFNKN